MGLSCRRRQLTGLDSESILVKLVTNVEPLWPAPVDRTVEEGDKEGRPVLLTEVEELLAAAEARDAAGVSRGTRYSEARA